MFGNRMTNAGDNPIVRFGEVISVKDPYRMFRAQVRVFGMTDDKRGIPDEDLPWYTPLFPVSSTSMGGSGHSSLLRPGSKVMVMILDYPQCQHGFIMGSHYPGPSSPSQVSPLAKGQKDKGPPIPTGADGNPIDLGLFGNISIIDQFNDVISKIKDIIQKSQIFATAFKLFKIGDK